MPKIFLGKTIKLRCYYFTYLCIMEKLCKKCNEVKSSVEFYIEKGKLKSPCKSCRITKSLTNYKNNREAKKAYSRKYHKNNYVSVKNVVPIAPWAAKLMCGISSRIRKSKEKPLAENIIKGEDINGRFIEDLYKKQGGKCYYTGVKMDFNKKLYKPSLDRIKPNMGYTNGNIVLCCMGVNFMKSDQPESELLELIKDINKNF